MDEEEVIGAEDQPWMIRSLIAIIHFTLAFTYSIPNVQNSNQQIQTKA